MTELTTIIIGRHIKGITLNDLEYVLDDNKEIKHFTTKESAREFLFKHGFTDDDIEFLVFAEVNSEGIEVSRS